MAAEIIKVTATRYFLSPERVCAGTRGSFGNEKLQFGFDEGWNGLSVKVVFYPARGKAVEVLYFGDPIDIPGEVMRHSGLARYIVSGSKTASDGSLEQKIITLEGHIDVRFTPDDRGANAQKVTPDTFDQFMDHAEDRMHDILEEAKESGEFNGPPGPALTYDDLTEEQKEALRGEPGDSGVFVKEESTDTAPESANVEVDLTEEAEDDPDIWIPDGLIREGNLVWMVCDGEKVGEPFEIIDGVNGENGADGKNFTILGYYDTLDALRAAVPEPEAGDAYGIGTEAPYNAWVFDGVTLDWKDNGPLSGVAGADGVRIQSIKQTTASDEDGGTNIFTVTLTSGVTAEFAVKNGSKGSDGYTPQKGTDYSDGYTPQRGTDYWTAADQQAIVDAVLANFTDASEVAL